ncbi:transglutaminase domain-containing protein [Geosporobacter ferrireducens]|nr:transglutaminase domain-containing protein [Geosporobacter ferrireducens]
MHIKYASYLTLLLFGTVNYFVLTYMLFIKRKWIRLIPGIYFILQWYRYVDQAFIYIQLYLFSLMLLEIIDNYGQSGLAEKIYGKEERIFSIRGWLLYSLFVCFSIIGLANLIPLQYKAVQVHGLAEKISESLPYIMDWRSEENEIEEFILGESKNSIFKEQLGGPILRDESIVMLVKAEYPLYLRGNIKDIYTGTGWKGSRHEYKEIGEDGIIPNLFPDDTPSVKQKVDIELVGSKAKVLYAPYRPIQVLLPSGNVYYNEDYELYLRGSLFSKRIQSYTIYSEIPRLQIKDLKLQMHQSSNVPQHYMAIPDELPMRVKELAKKLTATAEGDYNKMKNIEGYLRENHAYTLDGAVLPIGKDFVDYFLFETKKGYCSYYASALAVLGRCIGIPTRYVEGFVLPKERNEKGIYEVAASSAHAWVEAYIEGQGWIAYEPTPAFATAEAYRENEARQAVYEIQLNEVEQGMENNTPRHLINKREEDKYVPVNGAVSIEAKAFKYGNRGLFMLLILLLLRISYCAYDNKKMTNMISEQSKVLQYYRRIIMLCRHIDDISTQGCTPREVLALLGNTICPMLLEPKLIERVEKGLYCFEGASAEEEEQIQKGYRELEEAVKKYLGIPKYWFHKYLAGDLYKNRNKKA